jgi:MFS family permease
MFSHLWAPRGRPLQTCIFGAIIAFVNNFYQSYSSFYTNTAADSIQQYLNQSYVVRGRNGGAGLSEDELLWLWSLILNATILGNIFGTLCIPILCEKAGRKCKEYFLFNK